MTFDHVLLDDGSVTGAMLRGHAEAVLQRIHVVAVVHVGREAVGP
jgi:hypothetical protein